MRWYVYVRYIGPVLRGRGAEELYHAVEGLVMGGGGG